MKGLWNLPPRLRKNTKARCVARGPAMRPGGALKTLKIKPGLC